MTQTKLIVVLLLLTIAGSAQTSEPVLLQEVPPARLLAYARREDGLVLVPFSGVFELVVEVDGDRGLEVDPPAVWTTSAGWKIKNVERPTLTPQRIAGFGEGKRWRQTFVLDPITPAAAAVELQPLRYRNEDGRWHTIDQWKPIAVKVVTQIPGGDLKELREHPDIEPLPQLPSRYEWEWPAAALAAGLVVLLLIALWLRRRRRRSARHKAFEKTALYELTRLEALGLPEKGRGGEFHTLLANVVRRYLERRYELPARRLTTQEFSVLLAQTPQLSAEQKDFLAGFLRHCDLAKFAEAQVSPAECAELCRQTRSFLATPGA